MRRLYALVFGVVLSLSAIAPAVAKDHPVGGLDMYSTTVDAATAGRLASAGYDIVDQQINADGKVRLSIVLSGPERAQLRREGVTTALIRDAKGRTSRQRAAAQATAGFNVWRSWDQTGGIRDELYDIAKKNAGFVKLEVLGKTGQGREIIALKVTQGAKGLKDGARPAALFISNQHAREWISVEVNRRLLRWILDQRKLENPAIVDLLKTTELWFVVSANPDGYQYTFDHERLWRKNLRDNNGDGKTAAGDGVDPNRNFDEHWNYDNEGSSSQTASDTYRGPLKRSEPETTGRPGPDRQDQAEDAGQLALVRPAHPVPAGLAGGHAGRRQPDLYGARWDRRAPRHRGLRSRHQRRRAVRHERRDDRLRGRQCRDHRHHA